MGTGLTVDDLTLEDIAQMAGVSRATVSRILNNRVGARSKARDTVLEIIERTGFQPNVAARSLASQRTYVIGHVIPQRADFVFTDPYLTQLSQAIAHSCEQSEYILALFLITSESEEKKLYTRIANKGLLDGVIIHAGQGPLVYELIEKLSSKNIPFVISGRAPLKSSHVSYVAVDDLQGAYSAVSHLFQLGRKRIAIVTGDLHFEPGPGLDRLAGYRKALEERGVNIIEELIGSGDFTEESGYNATKQVLKHKPDAIFVSSDKMALGTLRALKELGISVPDDIAIVGFDDVQPSWHATPPLTTVRVPIEAMGRSLVSMLFDIIENGAKPPRRLLFDTELIIRKSCGAVADNIHNPTAR